MKNLKDMIGDAILDIPCKYCNSENTSIWADELEFSHDGAGLYGVSCHCGSCSKDFRAMFRFKYQVTAADYY